MNQPVKQPTLFDKIISGEIPGYVVWQDQNYAAFLTPFANTPGVTIVVPKTNPGDYIFDLNDDFIADFMIAVKKVAKLLEKALQVDRVGLAFEGTGVAHVHAKLYPFHGKLASQTNVWSKHQEFFPEYIGYFSTVEGPKMDDANLQAIQQKIQEVTDNEN